MTDAISRSAAVKALTHIAMQVSKDKMRTVSRCVNEIEMLPALDVAPVVHARWIAIRMAGERVAIQCSACKNYDNPSKVRGNYCWNCGAKMDGDADAD